jgi:hypothetical protein
MSELVVGRLSELAGAIQSGRLYVEVSFASGRVEIVPLGDYMDLPLACLVGARVRFVEVGS